MTEKDLTPLLHNQKVCDLEHPIFDIMATNTRRNLLRLISCEHNYGNQLAKILDVSNPTVHRHLKKLVDEGVLTEQKRTPESYSGHRGGEAVLYTIDQGVNLFLSVLPNLVHSHVIESATDGTIQQRQSPSSINYIPNDQSKEDQIIEYSEIASKSQQLTNEILELEKELTEKLFQKNLLMERVDNLLATGRLNFPQRIILRALACLGQNCYDDITNILNADPVMIDHYLSNLVNREWIRSR